MSTPFTTLLDALKRFANRYVHFICTFHTREELHRLRASNVIGEEAAKANIAAQNNYTYFFVTIDESLRVHLLLELAKFFDETSGALSVQWAIKVAQRNLAQLSKSDFEKAHPGREILPDLYRDYKPLTQVEVDEMEKMLAEHRELLQRLTTYRNNSLAHDAIEPDRVVITREETQKLAQLLDEVINKLSLHLDFSSYSFSHLEKECIACMQGIQEVLNESEAIRLKEISERWGS